MSKGPSVRKLNPLCASSSCRLLTPKSASRPSRLPGSITLEASENALGSSTTSGISSPSSAFTSSSRTLAASIASGSRSKPINLPLPPSLFAIAVECPASPSVASQITPPGRTFKYSRTSSKRTGTCRGLFIPYPPSVLPLGAKIVFYSLLPTPCLFRERHQVRVRQLDRSTCLLHLGVEQLCIHNLQQRLRPQHIHIARHLRQLPQLLRNQHPALRVHLCHLSVKVRHVQKLLSYRVHRGHLCQRSLNLLPLLQRVNLRPLAIHARDVELGPVQLIHPAFELGRELKPAFFINACWVISPKHIYLD